MRTATAAVTHTTASIAAVLPAAPNVHSAAQRAVAGGVSPAAHSVHQLRMSPHTREPATPLRALRHPNERRRSSKACVHHEWRRSSKACVHPEAPLRRSHCAQICCDRLQRWISHWVCVHQAMCTAHSHARPISIVATFRGVFCCSTSSGQLSVWDLESKRQLWLQTCSSAVLAIGALPSGKLLSQSRSGAVDTWNIETQVKDSSFEIEKAGFCKLSITTEATGTHPSGCFAVAGCGYGKVVLHQLMFISKPCLCD